MKETNSRSKIEFTELTKLINKKKVGDIRNYNVKAIGAAVKKTAKKRLCLGRE